MISLKGLGKNKGSSTRKFVVGYFFLLQDLDVILPTLISLRELGVRVLALLDPALLEKSPRVLATLKSVHIDWKVDGSGFWFFSKKESLHGVDAVVLAADTSAKPHAKGHSLALRANELGIPTYTFQHGLENIGLTYSDSQYKAESVEFASKTIFIWGLTSQLQASVPRATRDKCVVVGCPKSYERVSVDEFDFTHPGKALIVVFENLHWTRYSMQYRETFIRDVIEVCECFPRVTMILKPHHAGRWLAKHYRGRLPNLNNLIIADPSNKRWEPYTAPALIKLADAVVTTPSTTVYDSCAIGRPTSVIGYDDDVEFYSPLNVIRDLKGWMDFIDSVEAKADLTAHLRNGRDFVRRVSVAHDGFLRAAEFIKNELNGVPNHLFFEENPKNSQSADYISEPSLRVQPEQESIKASTASH